MAWAAKSLSRPAVTWLAPLLALTMVGCVTMRGGDQARIMKATTYDDGRSCPGNCEAHVVFKAKAHNGTLNAFRPSSKGGSFSNRHSGQLKTCDKGKRCAICFGQGDDTCMLAVYRGNGPAVGRFDFTPKFMLSRCREKGLPKTFATFCKSHFRTAAKLAKKINCIKNPTHAKCAATLTQARAAKAADLPKYRLCKKMGEKKYNKAQADRLARRANDCTYFRNIPACTRAKPCGRWRLAPASCRSGYFVGKNGLDCCSADPVQAAIDPVECGVFYR